MVILSMYTNVLTVGGKLSLYKRLIIHSKTGLVFIRLISFGSLNSFVLHSSLKSIHSTGLPCTCGIKSFGNDFIESVPIFSRSQSPVRFCNIINVLMVLYFEKKHEFYVY